MQASTIVTILTAVVAFVSALTGPQLDALWPGHGTQLSVYIGVAVLAIGQVINALTKQTHGAIVTSPLAPNLPVIDPTTGEQHGTNISSSSNLLPQPQKGGP